MTASQKPKTPSMAMKVRSGTSPEDVDMFCKQASRVKLSQVVDNVTVREKLTVEGQARRTQFTVNIKFFPKEEYLAEYHVTPLEILAAFATKFPLMLKKEMQLEMKKLDADLKSQIAELGKGKKVTSHGGDGEEEEEEEDGAARKKKDGDEGSEVGDGDADDEKRARQKKEQTSYESDESDNEDAEEYGDADLEAEFASQVGSDDEGAKVKAPSSFKNHVKKISDLFTGHLHQTTSFDFSPSGCTFQLEAGHFLFFPGNKHA